MSADDEPTLAAKLLRAEYPDEMAARSCTCEPDAMCGAHRLLGRYRDLYAALRKTNERNREHRARQQAIIDELRAAGAAPSEPPECPECEGVGSEGPNMHEPLGWTCSACGGTGAAAPSEPGGEQ